MFTITRGKPYQYGWKPSNFFDTVIAAFFDLEFYKSSRSQALAPACDALVVFLNWYRRCQRKCVEYVSENGNPAFESLTVLRLRPRNSAYLPDITAYIYIFFLLDISKFRFSISKFWLGISNFRLRNSKFRLSISMFQLTLYFELVSQNFDSKYRLLSRNTNSKFRVIWNFEILCRNFEILDRKIKVCLDLILFRKMPLFNLIFIKCYGNHSEYWENMSEQTVQTQFRLLLTKVLSVCHYIYIFKTRDCIENPNCSIFWTVFVIGNTVSDCS